MWKQYEKDKLDLQCDIIFAALREIPKDEQIDLLLQVIDYLRMENEECLEKVTY